MFALDVQEKKPFVTSGAAPARVMDPNTLPGAAKLPVKTFQLRSTFQNESVIVLEIFKIEVAPLLIESPEPPLTATVSNPVVVFTKSHENVEPESKAKPLLNESEPAPPTPGLRVPPVWIATALPNDPSPVSVEPAPETAVEPLTVTPEATSTRPPPEKATEVAPTLLVRRTTPEVLELLTWKFPPPVTAPTFTVVFPVLVIVTLPLVLVMLPIVVVPDPLFEIETPEALETVAVDKVPEPDFVNDNEPDELFSVPVKVVFPVPPTDTVEPATVAVPIVKLPALEFVIVKPALLVKLPLKEMTPVPALEIANAEAESLTTEPANCKPPVEASEVEMVLEPPPENRNPVSNCWLLLPKFSTNELVPCNCSSEEPTPSHGLRV